MTASSADATELARLIAAGEASALEIVDEAIGRIEKLNGELNAVIHPLYDDARRAAGAALPDGPLTGVPIVVKDLEASIAGTPYHAGIRGVKDAGYRADHDCEFVRRLKAAGAVIVAKTNTPELGLVPTTEPVAYGPSRNPWDTGRSTGGSSGGSAAAVASGMVPMGHANDGGGSIRIPASECGLVGLKPTRGRVPVWPDAAEDWGGLHADLVVSRTVRDTALALDVMGGPCPGDLHTPPAPSRPYREEVAADPGRLRIGVLTVPPDGATVTQPGVVAAVEAAARLLEGLGHTVDAAYPASLDRDDLVGAFLPCLGAWTRRNLDDWGNRIGRALTADDVEPGTWATAEIGAATTATAYLDGLRTLHRFSAEVQAWWAQGWDVLLTPTIPEVPPPLGEFGSSEEPLAGVFRAAAIVPFTIPFNITGQPAISLPLGESDGLPVGVQFVGAYGRDDMLLRLAGQLEQAAPWAGRRPPIWA